MKRTTLTLVLLTTLLTVAAQSKTHMVNVGDFDRLFLLDEVNVNYRCNPDSAGWIVIEGTPEEVSQLILTNNGKGKLTIQLAIEINGRPNTPTLTVYSSRLTSAYNESDSTLTLTGLPPVETLSLVTTQNGRIVAHQVKADKMKLKIKTGNGTIETSGECGELHMTAVGSGQILATELRAAAAWCRIFGTGAMYCRVDGGPLNVKGSGTGKVYYHGTPTQVKVRKLGSVRAIPLD